MILKANEDIGQLKAEIGALKSFVTNLDRKVALQNGGTPEPTLEPMGDRDVAYDPSIPPLSWATGKDVG